MKNEGRSITDLIESGNYKAVVSNLLEAKGLNYGSLPKGLLKFHRYATNNRTAMEEHLTEGALYAASSDGRSIFILRYLMSTLPIGSISSQEESGL